MARLRLWLSLLTSSIVSLISLTSVLEAVNEVNWQRHESWSVSVVSISIACSVFGAMASVLPPETGMRLELPLIVVVLGFWCAGLPAIVDPDHSLAVSPENAILNANLFFFSYASLLFSILLLDNWFEHKNGDAHSPTQLGWVLLTASSITVMASAVAIFRTNSCKGDESSFCNRSRFAVFGGMVSGVFALGMVLLRGNAPLPCQAVIGLMLLITWACGISYITFGSGPGTSLGSLYFSTWCCFFISIIQTATCAQIYIQENDIRIVWGKDENAGSGAAGSATGDAQPEKPAEEEDKA